MAWLGDGPSTTPPGEVGSSIHVTGVSKRFGAIQAVDDLSFDVVAGRVTGFLGPNGSGKTTTMRILLGLSEPDAGTAFIGARRYAELEYPIRRVGALIAADAFHPGRTARDHLRVMATAAGIEDRRVDVVLAEVGLTEAARRRVRGFSLGMRQRLGLAAALLGDPDVLILDEPLNGLDPQGINWVRGLLRSFVTEGRTVLLSSHLLAEIARTVDDVIVLDRGRLVTAAPLAELVADHPTDDLEQIFSDLLADAEERS